MNGIENKASLQAAAEFGKCKQARINQQQQTRHFCLNPRSEGHVTGRKSSTQNSLNI
jgi:hypothetical protein